MEIYRKPDGTLTHSSRQYVKAWRAITKPLEARYGLRVLGMDPDLLVQPASGYGKSCDLPLWLVNKMLEAK